MDMLTGIFPNVPEDILQNVLRVNGSSVEAASHWLLENDWQDLQLSQQQQSSGEQEENIIESTASQEVHARNLAETEQTLTETVENEDEEEQHLVSGREHGSIFASDGDNDEDGNSEEEDSEVNNDDDDDDDTLLGDEDEDDAIEDGDDSDDDDDDEDSDEDFARGLVPLAKRRKIDASPTEIVKTKEDRFWATFDGDSFQMTLIELLNTPLTKVAHSKVLLLNHPNMTDQDAALKMSSIISISKCVDSSNCVGSVLCTEDIQGFWAHFFSIADLDMIWRSILHAHLLSKRFDEVIEFHTALYGSYHARGFDEMMHFHSLTASSSSASRSDSFKCCIIIPCSGDVEKILLMGQHVHRILSLKDPLYFRLKSAPLLSSDGSIDQTNGESSDVDGRISEEHHRQRSEYRICRLERLASLDENGVAEKTAVSDYKPGKSVNYILQKLEATGWTDCGTTTK